MSKNIVKVVAAVIYRENGDILCAQRSGTMSLPYLWEFPGGKIEPGELPEQALVREIKEELNCDISVCDFITRTVYEYDQVFVDLSTYYATIRSGTPTLKEHEQFKWIDRKNLQSLEWAPADIPTVKLISILK